MLEGSFPLARLGNLQDMIFKVLIGKRYSKRLPVLGYIGASASIG